MALLVSAGCSSAAAPAQSTLPGDPAAGPPGGEAAGDQAAASKAAGARPAGDDPWLTSLDADHPLVGTIWKVEQGRPVQQVDRAAVAENARKARFVLLGEKHDNADHHRLQAAIIDMITAAGRKPVVAFEMIEPGLQPKVDAQLAAAPGDIDAFGQAIAWDQSGWPPWAIYRPVFAATLQAGLAVAAANLPRGEAMDLARGKARLPDAFVARYKLDAPLPGALQAELVAELHDSHCGHMPEAMITPMIMIQRARDARMAEALGERAGEHGAVLIAGGGHVREDRGVPWYLLQSSGQASGVSSDEIMTVAFVEVDGALATPAEYAARYGSSGLPFDYVWFTPRANDIDHCKEMEEMMKKKHGKGG